MTRKSQAREGQKQKTEISQNFCDKRYKKFSFTASFASDKTAN